MSRRTKSRSSTSGLLPSSPVFSRLLPSTGLGLAFKRIQLSSVSSLFFFLFFFHLLWAPFCHRLFDGARARGSPLPFCTGASIPKAASDLFTRAKFLKGRGSNGGGGGGETGPSRDAFKILFAAGALLGGHTILAVRIVPVDSCFLFIGDAESQTVT